MVRMQSKVYVAVVDSRKSVIPMLETYFCKSIPCLIEVEEYLRIAFEKYEVEELRKEAESQMAEKRS
uniref:Uncharacterized protein n=1 Tax=Wuchereria bancrofti TaxID=6293 RepID=A0A1I8EU03_WUCBA